MTIYSLVYFISRYNIHGNVIPGNAKLYRETNAPFVIVIFVLSLGGGVCVCVGGGGGGNGWICFLSC